MSGSCHFLSVSMLERIKRIAARVRARELSARAISELANAQTSLTATVAVRVRSQALPGGVSNPSKISAPA